MIMNSRDPAHFRKLYEVDPDPRHFRTSDYEREKYSEMMGALADRRLADCCDGVLAVDLIEAPLRMARQTCADRAGVRFRTMQVPWE